VYAKDKSLVIFLGGRPHNLNWHRDVVVPATIECDTARLSLNQSPAEQEAKMGPTLTGGVGATFNEPPVSLFFALRIEGLRPFQLPTPTYGLVLNALVFFQLFSTLAMKRVVGYGNCKCGWLCNCDQLLIDHVVGLLEIYCGAAFLALQAQKSELLKHYPTLMYPSDSSVFSAVTFEFGGPHRQNMPSGSPTTYEAAKWSCLTALGKYAPMHGGHIIFWDLGLVVCFPPGATILFLAGLIRYSFVKVRQGEHRHAVLQWAGGGIACWLANGCRPDVEFAVHATRQEHDAREQRRGEVHKAALESFPIEGELPEEGWILPFVGTDPTVVEEED
jgi:hypothetical protein